MEAKKQSYWWLFDSHNHPKCSSWLQSTLAELDEKTKAMLKLIDEEADSFAQRAEMYYKKRPELISMVEDFYRAHRSLAERCDQLRVDPATRARSSSMRHSFSHFPKEEYENVLSFVKSLDSLSLTEEGSHSEESEIDDPEQDGDEKQNYPFLVRGELEKLLLENEILRGQNEELTAELFDKVDEMEKVRRENALILNRKASEILNQKNQIKQKEQKIMQLTRKLEEEKSELIKFRDAMEIEIGHMNDALVRKDKEKIEAIRQLSMAMEVLREENQFLKKLTMKVAPKKWVTHDIKIFKSVNLGKLFGFLPKC